MVRLPLSTTIISELIAHFRVHCFTNDHLKILFLFILNIYTRLFDKSNGLFDTSVQ